MALALVGCGPRIELPVDSESNSGGTTAGEADADAEATSDDPSDTAATTTGGPIDPIAAEVVVLRFDRALGHQYPVALEAARLDGSEMLTLAELSPEAVGARFLGVRPELTAVLVDSPSGGRSQAVLADYAGGVQLVDGIGVEGWLTADALGVWSSEPDGLALLTPGSPAQAVSLGDVALQMPASRLWAWTGTTGQPAALHDLQGAYPAVTVDAFTRPADDPLCVETVHPGIWTSSDGSIAMSFPDPNGALLHRDTAGGPWMGLETYGHWAVGWDTCQDSLLIYGEDGALSRFSTFGIGFVPGQAAPLTDPIFGFSPDGRYAVGVGGLEGSAASVVVMDTVAETAIEIPYAPTGALRIGMVGTGYATLLYFPLSEEPSYSALRLTLASGQLVEIPHCGDFPPRVLDDGRVFVCDREDALGNAWGLQEPGGAFVPLGQDARDLRAVPAAGTPAPCVDTGVLPRIDVTCQ